MRVLLVVTPVNSHLLPIVPLAWSLAAAGHDVLLCGEPTAVETARAAGLHTVAVRAEPAPPRPPARERPPAPATGPGWQPDWDKLAANWRRRVGRVLDGYLELGREWRPDVVVCDPLEFCGPIVAGALGVPVIVHRWGPDLLTTQAREPAARALKDLAESAGSHGGLPEPALLLDPCPPSLLAPGTAPGRPVRFVPYNGAGQYPARRAGDGDGRTVCVSYSARTVEECGVSGISALAEAFDGLDGVTALITLGEPHAGQLGPVPANVRVVPPAPLSLLLDGCDALIHHGGAGTGLTALGRGLPQLVLPQALPALEVYGERLAAAGAGLRVGPGQQNDPAALRAAVGDLLNDPAYARSARACAREMRDMPLPAHIVPEIEELAAGPLFA
ncbi:nucleotide disphospho-sugar-binding domain-containing protein [Streptomyces rimosus]|uniref:nucleotide disphospho-sugar-binding domain-containing protein n=1 Tax=Streptomyces rimosus TaxID=1927 RepID=UPI0004C9BB49|nr:nucleotide disphospho-sugar-binding domain-containing protein [Streptomyces rimosus]